MGKIDQKSEKRIRNEAFADKHKKTNRDEFKKQRVITRKKKEAEADQEFWTWEATKRNKFAQKI